MGVKLALCLGSVAILSMSAVAAANSLPIIINVTTVAEGDSVLVKYNLFDPDGDQMTVLLRFAGSEVRIDGPAEGVAGDIERGITTGDGRVIALERSSLPPALPEPLVARVLAYDGRGSAPR